MQSERHTAAPLFESLRAFVERAFADTGASAQAAGRISAQAITPYPPGNPLNASDPTLGVVKAVH